MGIPASLPFLKPSRIVCLGAALALLAGCAQSPREHAAPVDLPPAWNAATPQGNWPDPQWWRGFQSTELDRLIELALADSPDVRIAEQRVRAAELAVQQAGASLFPSLGLNASTGSRRSEAPGSSGAVRSESSSAALNIGYEVDLWGRLSAGVRGAEASLDGERFDQASTRLTLTTGVANAYFQYLSLFDRLEIARQNLQLAERLMAIVETRARYGSASALDVSRQRTTVLSQRAALLPLQTQLRQTRHALALLVGKLPSELALQGDRIERLSLPAVGVDVPGAILSRRPDLARAEADLRAADAQVDVARAALLPTLQLSAGGSLATSTLLSLSDPTRVLSLTGSLAQNLFDGGKLRRQVDIGEVGVQQSWQAYRKTLLTAVKEVEDALVNVERQGTQELNQSAVRDEAQRSLQLSEQRYKAGAAGLSDVLDAQRTYFSAQDQLAQIRLSRLSASVDLIKALGGGWQAPRRSSSDAGVNARADEAAGQAAPPPQTRTDS